MQLCKRLDVTPDDGDRNVTDVQDADLRDKYAECAQRVYCWREWAMGRVCKAPAVDRK